MQVAQGQGLVRDCVLVQAAFVLRCDLHAHLCVAVSVAMCVCAIHDGLLVHAIT